MITVLNSFIIALFFVILPDLSLAIVQKISPPEQLNVLKTELESYFAPIVSKVDKIQDGRLFFPVDKNAKIAVGMRLLAFKEGVSFLHPVTKEHIGKMEIPLGSVEVIAISGDRVSAKVITGNIDDMKDALVKISNKKIRVLYHQSASDWYLADAYYQMLKDSGRYEMVDASVDIMDKQGMIKDATKKGTEFILVFESTDAEGSIIAKQTLIWTYDGKIFSEKSISLDTATVRQLRLNAGFFAAHEGDILYSQTLNHSAFRIAVGKVISKSKSHIIMASGDYLRIYELSPDMPLVHEHKIKHVNDTIWLDVIDLNKNGIDEILLTSMTTRGPVAEIYEFNTITNKLEILTLMTDTFIKRFGNSIVAQGYDPRDGYSGDIYELLLQNGKYIKGKSINLPKNIGIYDFSQITSSSGESAYLVWDDVGNISLLNKSLVSLWSTKEDYGGFLHAYAKDSSIAMIDRGKWFVKDRFINYKGETLTIKRVPLLNISRGAGYKSSSIKSLLWTGLSVQERDFVGEKSGEMIDFAIEDNKIIVLSKQLLVFNFMNILKGKSPIGVTINVYSTKGM